MTRHEAVRLPVSSNYFFYQTPRQFSNNDDINLTDRYLSSEIVSEGKKHLVLPPSQVDQADDGK
jgi:hypothetical protein